ncbi:MAG: lipid-A-disaccharide synthase [Candidatus Xenobiia bacterium LiM19]
MSKKIMIMAGEASGDLQGAALAGMLYSMRPSYVISGVGGPRMREKGVTIIEDSSGFGIIGPWHAIKKIPSLLSLVKRVKQTILRERPDLLILIDSPAVNVRLARFAKEHGITTLYFFPPSAWYPNVERAQKIAHIADYIVPAFAYSVTTYKNAGVNVNYFGHPLVDMLEMKDTREEVSVRLGLDESRDYVGILPGSREQEISSLLPVMLDTAKALREENENLEFLLPVAAETLKPMVQRFLKHSRSSVRMLDGCSHDVMKVSRLIMMASGSASLEAAIYGTPMIILYKLAWPDWCIGKLFIKVPFIALPNLIAERKVVPELMQLEVNPSTIVEEVRDLIKDTPKRQTMLEDLKDVRSRLGEPGKVLQGIGRLIVSVCEGEREREALKALREVG